MRASALLVILINLDLLPRFSNAAHVSVMSCSVWQAITTLSYPYCFSHLNQSIGNNALIPGTLLTEDRVSFRSEFVNIFESTVIIKAIPCVFIDLETVP